MTPAERNAIVKAKRGDASGFSYLYELHKRRVSSLSYRIVHNTAQAEELTQDTFLQVYRKLKSFRGDSAFSTWLHRIAVNVALMQVRRGQSRITEIPFEPKVESGTDDAAFREQMGSPDHSLRVAVDRLNLERAIAILPPGYEAVFLLHDVEGYRHEEIAHLMGCSVGNCKSQLHKARLKLRTALLGELRPAYPRSVRCRIRNSSPTNGRAA